MPPSPGVPTIALQPCVFLRTKGQVFKRPGISSINSAIPNNLVRPRPICRPMGRRSPPVATQRIGCTWVPRNFPRLQSRQIAALPLRRKPDGTHCKHGTPTRPARPRCGPCGSRAEVTLQTFPHASISCWRAAPRRRAGTRIGQHGPAAVRRDEARVRGAEQWSENECQQV